MKKLCFVIMGYGRKTDYASGKTFDLDKTYINIIKPAVEKAGFQSIRGDEIQETGLIDKSMYALLIHADLVIADITTFNPNALYELGIRHASRPYSTIIMKNSDKGIPFDINHNKIFSYSHMGDDISATEAERSKKALCNLIKSIDGKQFVDSPLFEFINVSPYKLPEEDYIGVLREKAEREDNLFAIVESAKSSTKEGDFESAKKLWKKALRINEDEAYYIQQLAFSIYKFEKPSKRIALRDASKILDKLDPENKTTHDPETLGLAGTIHKRLWKLNNDPEDLNRAIGFYKRGFNVNSDCYTGENYAICLDWKSIRETDSDSRTFYRILAKETREEVNAIIEEIFEMDDYDTREDIKWIYASKANMAYACDNNAVFEEYKELFKTKVKAVWEMKTFEDGISDLEEIKRLRRKDSK